MDQRFLEVSTLQTLQGRRSELSRLALPPLHTFTTSGWKS